MHTLNDAFQLHQAGQFDEAEAIYKSLLSLNLKKIDKINIFQLLGTLYLQKKLYSESKKYLEKSFRLNSKNPNTINNLGIVEKNLNNFEKAIFYFDLNISNNEFLDSYLNKINLLIKLNDFKNASKLVIDLKKKNPEDNRVKNLQAIIMFEEGYIDEALLIFTKLMSEKDVTEESCINFSKILLKLGKHKEALDILSKYINFHKTNNAEAIFQKYHILENIGNSLESEQHLLRAFELDHNNIEIKKNLILFYFNKKNFKKVDYLCCKFLNGEANQEFIKFLHNHKACSDIYSGNFMNISSYRNNLVNKLISHKDTAYIQLLNSQCDDPAIIKSIANYKWNKKINETKIKFENKKQQKNQLLNRKIKIAFISGDFRNHAVTHSIKDLFKLINSEIFETYAFSTYCQNDIYTDEVKSYFNFYYDISNMSYQEMYDKLNFHNLDIAIDLSGYTLHNQSWLFDKNIAKVKFNYLGYPGTMGTNCYDYLIADENIIPKELKKYYSEKILYLPNVYFPFSIYPKNSFVKKTDFDLPENKFLMTSFSRVEKITLEIFDIWMSILEKNSSINLVLNIDNDLIKKNIKNYCKFKSYEFDKIIFLKKVSSLQNYLERMSLFDLYLDTYPYNGHTTTSEALFQACVPSVTLTGKTFPSRVSMSLLKYANLDDLITFNVKDYSNKIDYLIKNKEKLLEAKEILKTRQADLKNRMIDFTREFEKIIFKALDI